MIEVIKSMVYDRTFYEKIVLLKFSQKDLCCNFLKVDTDLLDFYF